MLIFYDPERREISSQKVAWARMSWIATILSAASHQSRSVRGEMMRKMYCISRRTEWKTQAFDLVLLAGGDCSTRLRFWVCFDRVTFGSCFTPTGCCGLLLVPVAFERAGACFFCLRVFSGHVGGTCTSSSSSSSSSSSWVSSTLSSSSSWL